MDDFQLRALSEGLAAKLAELPEDGGMLRTVLIVCEVDSPEQTRFAHVCSDDRPWVQEAFASEFAAWVSRWRERAEDAALGEE